MPLDTIGLMAKGLDDILHFLALSNSVGAVDAVSVGSWTVVTKTAGISLMHAGVIRPGTVVLLEKCNVRPTSITFIGRFTDSTI